MSSIHPSLSDVAQGRVGTRIKEKWRVDKLLGVGGMGAVYAATHDRNGSRVALKILHPQLSMLGDIRARFAREGYVANAVNHPGVVRVLDDDVTEDGSAFLVMELLEGETTDARLRRLGGRLPFEDVALVGDGLLDVLAAAHASGIVHRDVKPENVFLTRPTEINKTVQVKVLDFGIARLRTTMSGGDEIDPSSGVPHLRTRTGVTIGTPAFMPPEQALGRTDEIDASSDLWAVGATLFMLVSGRIVHDARTHMEVVIAAATAQAKSLAQVAPDAPKALIEVIDRALAFKKEDRWPSARAMQAALRQALPRVVATPPTDTTTTSGHPSSLPGSSAPSTNMPVASSYGSQPPKSAAASQVGSGRWAEERKLATVLFGDIVGFSSLSNDLEPDGVHELAKAFFEPLAREVEREGGTVLKYIGDKVMAVFGVPVTHEDDAARAVRAAIAMCGRIREVARARGHDDVALRVGVNTGLVMVGSVGATTAGARVAPDIMGATVSLANRIEEAAQPGEILVGGPTERLVHDRFELVSAPPLRLNNDTTLAVFRVERERDDEPASSVRLRSASGTPFFARQAELELLLRLYESASASGSLRVAEVIGEMGLGKGHLLKQLRIALAAREPTPHILHATRMLGVAPLGFVGKMLRARFNVRVDESPEAVRARVVDAVAKAWGSDVPTPPADVVEDGRDAGRVLADLVAPTPVAPLLETELSTDATRTVSAFADWVRKLARAKPVVMLIEQVQWSDQGSVDLLQYLIRALRRERVFLVISARPESDADHVAKWLTGADIKTKIELSSFSEEVMERFLDDLFRQVPNFPREVKREIIRRAEGNPELCKELVRLLVDRGALSVDAEHVPIKWDKNRSAKLDLPDTVRGVLQARLDGLVPAHKEILKVASVVGRVFWVGALKELMPDVLADDLMTSLDALRARELLKTQATSSVSGERELTFSTQALCDAAYELVPRAQSLVLHRKVAEWLSGRGELWEGGQANLAQHLEAAGERPRARRLFLHAARHAVNVCAYPEAIGFFDRAFALWKDDTSPDERIARAGVLRERASAEARTGRFEDGLKSLDSAEQDLRAAGVAEDDAVHGWLLLERGLVLKEYGRIDESIELLERAADKCKLQPASLLHMRVYAARAFQRSSRGDRNGGRLDVEEGIRVGRELHVRDAAWHVAMARLKDADGAIHFHGGDLVKAEEAYKAALELRELAGDTQGMPDGLVNLGGVAYTRGDYPAAASYYERALAAAKKARWLAREAIGHSNLGQVKLALGEHEVAATELDLACKLAEEGGYVDVLADSARALAEVELARSNVDAAVERARSAIDAAERSKNAMFVALAHATAMDAELARMHKDRSREAYERARHHKDEATQRLTSLGQANMAESVAKRFGAGSNATIDTDS